MNPIDLHVHSTASDGSLKPAEVVDLARESGLKALALTDHDTTGGLEEALSAAAGTDLEVIPGVEFSVLWDHPGFLHLLGLFIDPNDSSLLEVINKIASSRSERNYKIIAKLQDMGMDITMAEVEELSGEGLISRAHIAHLLATKGVVETSQDSWRYIGKGSPAYVDRFRLDLASACRAIHQAGGLAVIAHPISMEIPEAGLNEFLIRAKADGLDGLEVWCPTQDLADRNLLAALARKHDLAMTGGSDFHGIYKPDIKLAYGRGDLRLDYELVEKLKDRLARG